MAIMENPTGINMFSSYHQMTNTGGKNLSSLYMMINEGESDLGGL